MLAEDGKLVEMLEQPYVTEDVLQQLLEDYHFVMVSREVSLVGEERGVGRIDHVFLDQEGVPTLVAVKRSSDTRIRREVVGQMLDYAANAVAYWPVEDIRVRFETTSADQGVDAEERLAPVIGDEGVDAFWARVGANLASGRLRLIFVADEIPAELKRIIEFLNEQMRPTEVLGVEVKQYADAAKSVRNLVPRVLGITAASETKTGSRIGRKWDESSFFQTFEQRDPEGSKIARRVLDWAAPRSAGIRWGSGKVDGSFYPRLFAGRALQLFVVYTNGTIEIRFGSIKDVAPFTDLAEREQLRQELKSIPGFDLPPDSIKSMPTTPIAALASDDAFARFTRIIDSAAARIHDAADRHPTGASVPAVREARSPRSSSCPPARSRRASLVTPCSGRASASTLSRRPQSPIWATCSLISGPSSLAKT